MDDEVFERDDLRGWDLVAGADAGSGLFLGGAIWGIWR